MNTKTADTVTFLAWRCTAVLAAALVLAAPQAPGQTFKKNGTAGFTFLEVPATARMAALGEASLALADEGSSSVFNNPAGLGCIAQTHSLSVSYAPWFADIKTYATSYSLRTDAGVFGVGAVLFDYGSMPRTVIGQGQKVYEVIGTFDARSLAVGLTYARMLTDRFSFGATAKYVREGIDVYAASNVLFDGGVLYNTGLGSFRIAASIQNFGVNAKFINDQFKMPSVLKLGGAVEVLGAEEGANTRVTLMVEALHPSDADEKVNVGAEVTLLKMVMLRGGYKFFSDEETYSVGLGIDPKLSVPFCIDAAFSEYGRLGRVVRLTVQTGIL